MRKVISRVVLGVLAGSTMLVAAGCQTSGEPYGLTGSTQMTPSERLKYTDQKGHYRPEYASRGEVIRDVSE